MMKCVAHIPLIFCVLITITKGWILPLGFDQQTFSPKKVVSLSRVTRQVNEEDCSLVVKKGLCSHPFAQKYINAVSQCGSLGSEEAIDSEKRCRQSSAGIYCSTVGSVPNTCGSNGSCSTVCRKSLTDFGCCLNQFPYKGILKQNFAACGLASPSACPPTSLTIPTFSDNPSCLSSDDFFVFKSEFLCNNGRPLLDDLISNNCLIIAREIEDSCRYRDGKNCIEVLKPFTMQENAAMNCPSTSNCSSACRSTLNGFKDSLGCCLNLFNASLRESSNGVSKYPVITDNALWQECGITPPGVCELLINAAAPSAYTTAGAPSAYTTAGAPSAYTTAGNIAFRVLAASMFNFA